MLAVTCGRSSSPFGAALPTRLSLLGICISGGALWADTSLGRFWAHGPLAAFRAGQSRAFSDWHGLSSARRSNRLKLRIVRWRWWRRHLYRLWDNLNSLTVSNTILLRLVLFFLRNMG